jgi:hypothetical protein
MSEKDTLVFIHELVVRVRKLDSVAQLVRDFFERCTGITGPQGL